MQCSAEVQLLVFSMGSHFRLGGKKKEKVLGKAGNRTTVVCSPSQLTFFFIFYGLHYHFNSLGPPRRQSRTFSNDEEEKKNREEEKETEKGRRKEKKVSESANHGHNLLKRLQHFTRAAFV